MATQLPADLIDEARKLELFDGDAGYYHPEGNASSAERDHLLRVIVQTAIERLEAR